MYVQDQAAQQLVDPLQLLSAFNTVKNDNDNNDDNDLIMKMVMT